MSATTSESWLSSFLDAHGAIAGTIHRVQSPGLMVLEAAVNIPEPVRNATAQIPAGKGMAGIALAEDRCVFTCNLQEDTSGAVRPGAKAVAAAAAVAVPVHDPRGSVRAVVGIAWRDARPLDEPTLVELQKAGEAMPLL
jgi:L-methionine (R)-S-oxide reductase